ncbi:unnamed protein product [Rotaria sp. Silwood2]|nr:unnamed protein product [Rotaria sp. Silwood2]
MTDSDSSISGTFEQDLKYYQPSRIKKQHGDRKKKRRTTKEVDSKFDPIVERNDEEVNDQQSVQTLGFQAKSDSISKPDNLNTNSNEENTIHDSNAIIAAEDTNNITVPTATRNNRLIAVGGVTGIKEDLDPVVGYAAEPLLPLHEACVPLSDILHNLSFYVDLALNETPQEPPDSLTVDESAAIRLYTIEWEKPHRSLYSMLNYTLKTAPREELRPYFKYMKLFLTALVKLPCIPPLTVWRGVAKDLSAEFPPGTLVTWWAFSSCTSALPVLENNMYLGSEGERTLFSVEAINGRTVQAHSHFVTEDEILLLPGTHMEVQSQFRALLYPPENKKKPWYKKKRTIIELALIIIICIAGVIVGAVLGSRRPPPPPMKNASVIRFEATVLCQYRFNSDDLNAGWGPNNIRGRSQHVYRSWWNNQSVLLFNDSDSYFQSSGFTLMHSNAYEYSIAFWLRLKIQKPEKVNSVIAVLQLTSSISALSSDSYTCVMSIHVYPDNQTLGYFFPGIFELLNVSGSFIENNTWVHIGVAFESPQIYYFYQNGKLIANDTNRRFSSIISDDPRFSVTVGGAYLDDSDPNKPDNFEQMKCFARIPSFNYTKMYGEIDDLTFYSRILNSSEFSALASSHITDSSV